MRRLPPPARRRLSFSARPVIHSGNSAFRRPELLALGGHMNTRFTTRLLLSVAASAIVSLASLANESSGTASAADRPHAGRSAHSTVTRTGPRGRSATRDSTVTGTDRGFERSTTVTGPKGAKASTDVTMQK